MTPVGITRLVALGPDFEVSDSRLRVPSAGLGVPHPRLEDMGLV